MGQKVPVANDGSNYYQARQYNDPYDRDNGNPCVEVSSEVSGGLYARQNSAYVLASQPKWGILAADFGASGNSLTFATTTWLNSGSFTFEARLNEPMQWIDGNGNVLSLDQREILQEAYARVPDHEFNANFWGQCEDCPTMNMYRREMSAHLYVIQETPDWLHELAS